MKKPNRKLDPKVFDILSDRDKWDLSKTIENVMWCCKFCKHEQGTERPQRMFMNERCCYNCDTILTKRTNGGQNDLFNYTFKKI